jgi:hypothetical protein
MTALWLHRKTGVNYNGTCDYGNSNIEYMDPSKYIERKQGVDNSLQYRGALQSMFYNLSSALFYDYLAHQGVSGVSEELYVTLDRLPMSSPLPLRPPSSVQCAN